MQTSSDYYFSPTLWQFSPNSTSFFFKQLQVKWSHSVMSDSLRPMDCSPPGSSIHGIHQARILEWVAISFSRGSSQPRDWTQVSHIAGRCFNLWATREALTRETHKYPLNWSSSQPKEGKDRIPTSHVISNPFTWLPFINLVILSTSINWITISFKLLT